LAVDPDGALVVATRAHQLGDPLQVADRQVDLLVVEADVAEAPERRLVERVGAPGGEVAVGRRAALAEGAAAVAGVEGEVGDLPAAELLGEALEQGAGLGAALFAEVLVELAAGGGHVGQRVLDAALPAAAAVVV